MAPHNYYKATLRALIPALLVGLLATASAAPFVVPKASLQPPQVTFSEVPGGIPLDGLTINGFTFSESSPLFNTAASSSGPGDTNNVDGEIALSLTNPAAYVLTVTLPGPSIAFGFGFALLASTSIPNAVTITLFNGVTNLGSLAFDANLDPTFPGGFAGIGNAVAFTSVQITFDRAPQALAIDNFSAIAVPEPSSVWLLGLAAVAVFGLARVRQRRA